MKIPIYGRHSIPEAWLMDLQRRVVTIYQQPCGEGYRDSIELTSGLLAPASLPDITIDLAELFV
jgi:Uma2 family endonuclease